MKYDRYEYHRWSGIGVRLEERRHTNYFLRDCAYYLSAGLLLSAASVLIFF